MFNRIADNGISICALPITVIAWLGVAATIWYLGRTIAPADIETLEGVE